MGKRSFVGSSNWLVTDLGYYCPLCSAGRLACIVVDLF
jgi:hypothetical protein